MGAFRLRDSEVEATAMLINMEAVLNLVSIATPVTIAFWLL